MGRALLLLCCSLAWSSASAGGLITDEYDSEFRDAAIFLPAGTDWRLLKSQCYQESRLNPLARSPVGAMGLCQFMPATWGDMTSRYDGFNNPWLPEQSIRAAALYMGQMMRFWSAPRPQNERYKLALASYNAGAGNLLKAQRLATDRVNYAPIADQLHRVTGHHSKETLHYVHVIIHRWYPLVLAQ